MSMRITTGMRIEATRIGVKPTELGGGNLADARKIDRAINSAVRKERERCVGIVQQSRGTGEMVKYERAYMCDAIAEKIRKGKA